MRMCVYKQFFSKTFPKGDTRSCDYGKLPKNKLKNHYESFPACK